jgi:biopolymer transport protein ExbD
MLEHEPPQHSHLHKVDDIADDPPPRFRKRPLSDDEMDITPMIDMTFLLLIFFLVASKIDTAVGVTLPKAKYGAAVPVKDSVFVTLDEGVDGAARVYLADGIVEESEVVALNLEQQENQIIAKVEKQLATSTPRKHQVVVKAAAGLKHREVARVVAALGQIDSLEHVHIGVLEEQ